MKHYISLHKDFFLTGIWSEWSKCESINVNNLCGKGTKKRHCIRDKCVGNYTEECMMDVISHSIMMADGGESCSTFCNSSGYLNIFMFLLYSFV